GLLSETDGGLITLLAARDHRSAGGSAAFQQGRRSARSAAGDLLEVVRLDDVARLEVLVVLEPDAALEARLHLAHVVLEPPQRRDRAVPDDDALPQEADLRTTRDGAVEHVATGDLADPRHRE